MIPRVARNLNPSRPRCCSQRHLEGFSSDGEVREEAAATVGDWALLSASSMPYRCASMASLFLNNGHSTMTSACSYAAPRSVLISVATLNPKLQASWRSGIAQKKPWHRAHPALVAAAHLSSATPAEPRSSQ